MLCFHWKYKVRFHIWYFCRKGNVKYKKYICVFIAVAVKSTKERPKSLLGTKVAFQYVCVWFRNIQAFMLKTGNISIVQYFVEKNNYLIIASDVCIGQSWRGGTKCDCKTDWLWVRSSLEEIKYLLKFIFSFLRSGVEARRTLNSATQHAMPSEFGRK